MLVVNLACARDHTFEGWFASADDLASQQARGLLSCPLCGDTEVVRRPSAPRLNMSGAAEPVPDQAGRAAQAQQQWVQAARQLLANTEDVGERFADEARAIHHGDAPERGIRGQATPQERQALVEEGIEVLSLPVPEALKGPVQ